MAIKDSIKLFLLKTSLTSDTRIKQQHIKWTSNDTQQLNVYTDTCTYTIKYQHEVISFDS